MQVYHSTKEVYPAMDSYKKRWEASSLPRWCYADFRVALIRRRTTDVAMIPITPNEIDASTTMFIKLLIAAGAVPGYTMKTGSWVME